MSNSSLKKLQNLAQGTVKRNIMQTKQADNSSQIVGKVAKLNLHNDRFKSILIIT